METEFEAINKALELSLDEYQNEVLVVYKKGIKNYAICPESEYTEEDEYVCGKYLNGRLAPV